jgi:hypothetical protein
MKLLERLAFFFSYSVSRDNGAIDFVFLFHIKKRILENLCKLYSHYLTFLFQLQCCSL